MNLKHVHFDGLTELRGIAAMVVVISHIDQFYYLFGFSSFGWSRISLAEDAVTLFFVLSGFLISYLLVQEKELTKTINIKHFYYRRILRIWPVYFLSIIISLFMVRAGISSPPQNLSTALVLYTLLLANLAYVLGLALRPIVPLWSVGVEEQFYLLWPWMVKKNTDIRKSLLVIIVLYLITKITIWHIQSDGGEYALVKLTRIDCMALGGLFALAYHNRKNLKFLYSLPLQLVACVIVLIPLFYSPAWIYNIEIEIKALAYGIIILNVATNKNTIILVKNKLLRFLGKISYGLYCYHMIVIYFVSHIYKKKQLLAHSNNALSMVVQIIILSVLFSYLSYFMIEAPLLKLKKRFSSISHV